jgi:hypothetical protein
MVSIAIQRVKTREKFVRKLREYHSVSKTVKVMKKARGKRILAIIDSRIPTKIKIVTKTSKSVCNAVFPRFL